MKMILLTPEELAELVEKASEKGARKGVAEGVSIAIEKDEWLTRTEAAKMLKVKPATVDKWRGDGLIQSYYIGRSVRFKKSDLLNFDPNEPPRY